MYFPNTTILGAVIPVSGVADYSLHTFVGISWEILLPYTLLGVGLMIYSQVRLARGEKALKRASKD